MATITIELPDETLRELTSYSRESHLSVEAVVANLANEMARSLRESAVSEETLNLMDRLITQYRPVFQRLAQ